MSIGSIRVGRRIYDKSGKFIDPTYPGFTPIICLTKSTAYGSLGPYELFDEKGRNMECVYQFSKIYEFVPEVCEKKSRYDQRVIWKHPAERHAVLNDNGKSWGILPAYFNWRAKGMSCKDAIRYPVGYKHRSQCLFSLPEDDEGNISNIPLNYIEARKKIYLPLYQKLVKLKPQYQELEERLNKGENLLIIEVDACHEESLQYYKDKYQVDDDFIVNHTMLVNKRNLEIMLNDDKHAFGHCFCLSSALLNIDLK